MTMMRPLVFAAALLVATGAAAAQAVTVVDDAAPVPPFSLRDDEGKPFDNARLAGRWSLVAIGFTYCPDVCPFTLSNLEAVHARLTMLTSPERLPQVVFVGVDPDRDAEMLHDYVAYFHPDFVGVTGPKDQIDVLVGGIEAFYQLQPPTADGVYTVDHTAFVALVDPQGTLRAKLSLPLDPDATARYIVQTQRQDEIAE